MKIGAVFPHLEIGDDPVVIRDWAQTAEGLGYSHLLVYDHVIGAVHEGRKPPLLGPYTEDSAFHELFVLLGYFAACTERVGLTSGVLILPQRQTVLVAKQAAEVDILSGGRLRLGVGTGWNHVEYDSLNEDFHNRGRRQAEQVELLRALWQQPVLDYQGEWHRVERAGLKPLPGRDIPIWFGGFVEAARRRAAKIGDGFIFAGSHKQSLEGLQSLRKHLASNGRSQGSFGIEAILSYQAGPDKWLKEVKAWQAEGAEYVSMQGMARLAQGEAPRSPQAHIDSLSTYWERVAEAAA